MHKAEKKLLKECLRTINNTTELTALKRRQVWDTAGLYFSKQQNLLKDCREFINKIREGRNYKILEQQRPKFEGLTINKSKKKRIKKFASEKPATKIAAQTGPIKASTKWATNLSNTPWGPRDPIGPNFAVVPRNPPHLEYITVIE